MFSDSNVVGRVEEVAPDSVLVRLYREAPHGTAFQENSLHRFPHVHGYVVLPTERGPVLAIATWVGATPEHLPDGRDARIGLPQPVRSLRAVPLGLVRLAADGTHHQVERGTLVFPTIGDPVRLPSAEELGALAPAGSVRLGLAPALGGASVALEANRLFGRHLAILGNTGSGKSCTLTHLLRTAAHVASEGGTFRAVLLDLNGEYGSCFRGLPEWVNVRRFDVEATADEREQLRVPYWLWNYREWAAFADASGKSQGPILRQTLHTLRQSGGVESGAGLVALVQGRRVVREFLASRYRGYEVGNGLSALDAVEQSLPAAKSLVPAGQSGLVDDLARQLSGVLRRRRSSKSGERWQFSVPALSVPEAEPLLLAFEKILEVVGLPYSMGDVASVDVPKPFDAANLLGLLDVVAAGWEGDASTWVAPMRDRLAVSLSDERLGRVSNFKPGESLGTWLQDLIGNRGGSQLTVLDLSLVPPLAQQLVAAVICRTLLEALERHRRRGEKRSGGTAPVILAVEEAHALMRRKTALGEAAAEPVAELCRTSFERVAREGRKFGLSLVVSSQRPSELSETVLSQCNTFVIHRLVNPADQNLVSRLVPDSIGGLLAEIQSYPAGVALVVGAAVPVPVVTCIDTLAPEHRPSSADPDFTSAWTSGVEVDCASLANDWAGLTGGVASSSDSEAARVKLEPDGVAAGLREGWSPNEEEPWPPFDGPPF